MIFRRDVLTGVALGLASLVLYTITLAPDVLAHDSGEWQAAATTLGISHSPGSPAYIILGWLFSLFPLGTPAARVSFVSAVISAIGVGALYAFMMLLLKRTLPAVLAAVTLGVAGLWWSHASVATPYNAIPAIMSIMLCLLLLWSQKGDNRLIWVGALVFGFGLSMHPSLMFFLPTLLAGIFVLGPWRQLLNPRSVAVTVLPLALGLSFYIYIPIRSSMDPDVAWGRVDSVSSFLDFVSAGESRSQGHGVLSLPDSGDLGKRLTEVVRQSYYPSFAFLVFGPAVVLLYPAVWPALRRLRRQLIFMAAGMVGHMFIVFAISGVYAQYYLPLLFYFSIWSGFSLYLVMTMGEAYVTGKRYRYVPAAITGAIYLVVLSLGMPAAWSLADHRHDEGMRTIIDEVLSDAGPGAVVLANWESYGGLLYAQKVEGQRPDVTVFSVPQSGWRDFLPQAESERPGSQVLLALTLPNEEEDDMTGLSGPIFVTIKGRTQQDYSRGEPLPATVRLYELKP